MLNALRSRVQSFIGQNKNTKGLKNRMAQYEIDMKKLTVLLSQREHQNVTDMPFNEQESLVQELVEAQVKRMFSAVHESTESPIDEMVHGNPFMSTEVNNIKQRLNAVEAQVEKSVGYVPIISKSTIDHPAAGEGVFVQGTITKGSLVAIYPGRSFLPFQVTKMAEQLHRSGSSDQSFYHTVFGSSLKPNPHCIQRFDGGVIDASVGSMSLKPNCFAVGHKINHPPKDSLPNVIVCPFNFTEELVSDSPHSKDYIPNEIMKEDTVTPGWWWNLVDKHILAPSIALVAIRDIENQEEIFVNYRFNPNVADKLLPDWYFHVNIEENKKRWAN